MLDKRYDPKQVESNKYEFWKENDYFKAGIDKSKTPFSMVIPPPNVTGKLHLGHAWDTTIQDIVARYKRLQGLDVLWLPGMDHAGIATQAKVMERLRKEGVDVTKISREDFLKKSWEWKDEYGKNIHNQWAMLGLSLDYSRERFTLDDGLNKAVNEVFKKLYDEGLIYQGERIINWDPVQLTALSNIEVIHEDDKGEFFYFAYPLVDNPNEKLIVATTRPETMFGDVCLVVNPNDDRFKSYIGKKAINPANDEPLTIIGDEYVDIEFGTGVMKCTPAHDPNDFLIAERHNLPKLICMNKDATINSLGGKYEGMDRYECRKKLVEDIDKKGLLIKIEKITHPVGHSERSGAVVEPMLSKQWFVKMKPLAEKVLECQRSEDKVKFIPARFNNVLIRWMESIEDWCISRQLWWGHRIPAWYHKDTGEIYVNTVPPKDIENWTQDTDVLDTWFSSGLWPFSTLGWPNETEDFKRYFPTDVLSTGYDIIFFWVSRMLFQSLKQNNKVPFKACIIHGLVRDEKGRKMSKSLGNGIDPNDVIDRYGADALRYFLTSNSTPGLDMRYSEEKVQASANYLNKIWNSARYILGVLPEGFKAKEIKKNELNALDQYIINKMEETIKLVTHHMERYDFNAASTALYNFVYDDFCSFYLEMSKVSLNDENKKDSCYQTLFFCLNNIILMIYPYTPFIGEELYQSLPEHKKSIMEESYPTFKKSLVDTSKDNEIILLNDFIKEVRNYKIESKMAPNAKVKLILNLKFEPFNGFNDYLSRFTFADSIEIKKEDLSSIRGKLFIHSLGAFVILDETDPKEALAKVEADIKVIESEILRSEKMLNNPGFIAKAPKEKIDLEKAKLEKNKETLKSLLEKKANI